MQETESTTLFCGNCGVPTNSSGKKPQNGVKYCSNKKCQNVARKERNRNKNKILVSDKVPESCSNCGENMPSRAFRPSDVFGRFCRKSGCREAQRLSVSFAENNVDKMNALEILENTVSLLVSAVEADNPNYIFSSRVVCETCGLTSALNDWVHPNQKFDICYGTINGVPFRKFSNEGISGAWPFKREYNDVNEKDSVTNG